MANRIPGEPLGPGDRRVGWIYRTQGVPAYLKVEIDRPGEGKVAESFPDNEQGARGAAGWISETVQRDDWRLQSMEFLGHRIVVPEGPPRAYEEPLFGELLRPWELRSLANEFARRIATVEVTQKRAWIAWWFWKSVVGVDVGRATHWLGELDETIEML